VEPDWKTVEICLFLIVAVLIVMMVSVLGAVVPVGH